MLGQRTVSVNALLAASVVLLMLFIQQASSLASRQEPNTFGRVITNDDKFFAKLHKRMPSPENPLAHTSSALLAPEEQPKPPTVCPPQRATLAYGSSTRQHRAATSAAPGTRGNPRGNAPLRNSLPPRKRASLSLELEGKGNTTAELAAELGIAKPPSDLLTRTLRQIAGSPYRSEEHASRLADSDVSLPLPEGHADIPLPLPETSASAPASDVPASGASLSASPAISEAGALSATASLPLPATPEGLSAADSLPLPTRRPPSAQRDASSASPSSYTKSRRADTPLKGRTLSARPARGQPSSGQAPRGSVEASRKGTSASTAQRPLPSRGSAVLSDLTPRTSSLPHNSNAKSAARSDLSAQRSAQLAQHQRRWQRHLAETEARAKLFAAPRSTRMQYRSPSGWGRKRSSAPSPSSMGLWLGVLLVSLSGLALLGAAAVILVTDSVDSSSTSSPRRSSALQAGSRPDTLLDSLCMHWREARMGPMLRHELIKAKRMVGLGQRRGRPALSVSLPESVMECQVPSRHHARVSTVAAGAVVSGVLQRSQVGLTAVVQRLSRSGQGAAGLRLPTHAGSPSLA